MVSVRIILSDQVEFFEVERLAVVDVFLLSPLQEIEKHFLSFLLVEFSGSQKSQKVVIVVRRVGHSFFVAGVSEKLQSV